MVVAGEENEDVSAPGGDFIFGVGGGSAETLELGILRSSASNSGEPPSP